MIRAKVVLFGVKPKLMKCRFQLTYFYDIIIIIIIMSVSHAAIGATLHY
jgi:hypothetical protein